MPNVEKQVKDMKHFARKESQFVTVTENCGPHFSYKDSSAI